jgi:hypothetical protein
VGAMPCGLLSLLLGLLGAMIQVRGLDAFGGLALLALLFEVGCICMCQSCS